MSTTTSGREPQPSPLKAITRPVSANERTPVAQEEAAEEAEILRASIKAGTVAQIVIALIAIIGFLYLLKLVLVTALTAMLLAYMLEPMVRRLVQWRVPRSVGSLIVVVLGLALAGGIAYFFFNRAVDFADELPHYSARARETVGSILSRANQIEAHAKAIIEPPNNNGKRSIPVKVEQADGLTHVLSENGGTIMDVLLAIGFIPFLVYFMLASKEHFHVATVRLFPKEHRLVAHRTVGNISSMIRTYIVANVGIGLLNAAICAIIFWTLGIQYFYFVGAISGFLSLIPYLGVFLALLPPLAAGIDALGKTGILVVLISVVGLHVVTMNVIYPKVIGERLKLNPLAVSLSLLFWAWIWGGMGLILAIPILGAAKIVCDHIDPLGGLGTWLSESARQGSR
ncbi:MAG TPA: AI-2E family transporter [Terriglobales bacterium]|nr:AI-2E family transporter [Terriglobales bacterium]